ncbi:MAG: zinc ABC transporter substrate-binding protein [Firmicutes bacterium]|nr:zinc ABC transporter substrate-binding protein [Bacillota bacterium]
MKKLLSILLAALMLLTLTACGDNKTPAKPHDDTAGQQQIVTTNIAAYDWLTELTQGSSAFNLTLLGGGIDMHSYQPTTNDLIAISTCDYLVFCGGESDAWVRDFMQNSDTNMQYLSLLDALGEAACPTDHDHDHDHDMTNYDEHVWLSLTNAQLYLLMMAETLSQLDPDGADIYRQNAVNYSQSLALLHAEYQHIVANAAHHTILVADRFPFCYLVRDYGIEYFAAFPGCSSETNASFETIAFLADKVDELGIKTVLTIDKSDQKIANTVIQNTKAQDAQILTLHSLQTREAEDGMDYLAVMEQNLRVLEQALN